MSPASSITAHHLLDGESFDPTGGPSANLTAAWSRHWTADPTLEQIHDPERGWVTRGELDRDSRVRAGRLAGLGLFPGDRVLLSAESSYDLVASYVAALRMGLVVIPTNTAYGARELEHVINDARPKAALVDTSEKQAALAAIDPDVHLLSPSLDISDGETPSLDQGEPESPALICYTSGTTGQPKGAVLSHANCLASAEGLRHAWRWQQEDRLLLCLPLFHMHGLGVGLHGTLYNGSSAVLYRSFDPDRLLSDVSAQEATLFFGVPTMYHRFATHPEVAKLSGLRLCVSGSAPLPATLHEKIESATGQRVLERYGMTETLMLVSNPFDAERRAGSVGFPLPGVELRLEGEPPEIQVRGPNVFAGYWERPKANAEAFTADGWFKTGDLGAQDAEGYISIVGRAKELIISGGYNIYPREIEDVLRKHPAIDDVAVVGEASEEWGETVVAYAVASEPLNIEALRQSIGDQLASFKHPRALHIIDALPRNALGKVQKHRLQDGKVLPN